MNNKILHDKLLIKEVVNLKKDIIRKNKINILNHFIFTIPIYLLCNISLIIIFRNRYNLSETFGFFTVISIYILHMILLLLCNYLGIYMLKNELFYNMFDSKELRREFISRTPKYLINIMASIFTICLITNLLLTIIYYLSISSKLAIFLTMVAVVVPFIIIITLAMYINIDIGYYNTSFRNALSRALTTTSKFFIRSLIFSVLSLVIKMSSIYFFVVGDNYFLLMLMIFLYIIGALLDIIISIYYINFNQNNIN